MATPPSPLRCVVLHHAGVAEPHYDVLFETSPGSSLATWRSPRWPLEPGDLLVRAPDHRSVYLTYEGPVSGDRGTVRRVFYDVCAHVALGEGQLEATFSDGTELTLTRDGRERWSCRMGSRFRASRP